ncbi:hypothetical protein X474_05305 [Dethiosulfatarculus sandiegensis]|uniref:Uncharacterized protein n=1 Tax=Dethiosulfatarculus sandiegensis TaxID=1429043 RepID=A0A0D2JAS1_9BACT|nr:hypothetical protein X474_05305 [Dethiosulfatarculus sandiegensis]
MEKISIAPLNLMKCLYLGRSEDIFTNLLNAVCSCVACFLPPSLSLITGCKLSPE